MREHLVLVVEFPAARVERRLVERRERDAVEAPGERELDHVREGLAGDASRIRGDRAARYRIGIEVGEVDQRHLLVGPVYLLGFGVGAQGELHAGILRAALEHARIADHDQARNIREPAVGQHARALLRADAGEVAEHESDEGRQIALLSVK